MLAMKLVLLFIPFFLNVGSAQQCKKVTYSVRGYFLRDHLISTSNVKNIGQCLIACSQDQRCRSINFKFLGSICELNDADRETKPGDYKLNDGYAYSDYPIKAPLNHKVYKMTPQLLKAHASYIDNFHSIDDDQVTFHEITHERVPKSADMALLKIPLIPAGMLPDQAHLTVKIIATNEINTGVDSDPSYGPSDGTNFVGFEVVDTNNYDTHPPCFGTEGTSGLLLKEREYIDEGPPLISNRVYPGQFIFTLKPHMMWGSCFTTQDGGFNKTALYSKRLKPSKGLILEVYKDGKKERVGIKYIEVHIIKSG